MYVCVVGTAFVRLLERGQVWMPPPETLCERYVCVCVCVCECVCVCVRPNVYACQKNSMGVCVCLLFMCCQDHVCEFAMAVPSVDASATDIVCVLCV